MILLVNVDVSCKRVIVKRKRRTWNDGGEERDAGSDGDGAVNDDAVDCGDDTLEGNVFWAVGVVEVAGETSVSAKDDDAFVVTRVPQLSPDHPLDLHPCAS